MARLTFDALLILARVRADEDTELVDIAFDIFNGYDPAAPLRPTKTAMLRATRAAQSLVAMKRAKALPNLKTMSAIRTNDPTGGAVQAQFLMNLVVRGSVDRRSGERRAEPRPNGDARGHDRRSGEPAHPRPLRILRAPPPKPVKKPSPFDTNFVIKHKDKP